MNPRLARASNPAYVERMAEKITPRDQDFSKWYQDVVLQAKLADYSPVKGCMVIRPNGYSIWEALKSQLDQKIKRTGARNAYFPVFIPEGFLKKEAEHVEGFSPQCAVVTHAGGKELEEKLVVRPTSETIINSMFSKWVQSYRDLPLKINQWANVVRWEMRTRLFLRTTEFLWQEGHTCHETAEESEAETQKILEVYRSFAEEVLAMPVIAGLKSDSERFAGALRTYCIEAMMQDKKALQAGTSHNLSTNFAKAFNIQYLGREGKNQLVHQTSWGVSTRLIGGMIMTHSDDKGLVLPPRLAATQAVIVPIMAKKEKKDAVLAACKKLKNEIQKALVGSGLDHSPEPVLVDDDETKQPGWKFHEYELLGIPFRIELGPRDLDQEQAVLVRRDIGKKEFVPFAKIPEFIRDQLVLMQKELLEKARRFRDENMFEVEKIEDLAAKLESPGGFGVGSWCEDAECEKKLEPLKATIRCIMLNPDHSKVSDERACCLCGKASRSNVRVVLGKSY